VKCKETQNERFSPVDGLDETMKDVTEILFGRGRKVLTVVVVVVVVVEVAFP